MIKKIIKSKVFILVILVGLFVLLSNLEGSSFFKKQNSDKEVDSEQVVDSETKVEKIEEEIVEDKSVVLEDVNPTEILPTENIENKNIDFLIYPNANIISKNNSIVVMETIDDTDSVTGWYSDRINEYDMNVTSTVKTKTNGNVLNKLSASNGSLKVEIEISASNESSIAKITAKLL